MQLFKDKNGNHGFICKNDFEIQNNLYNAVYHKYFH